SRLFKSARVKSARVVADSRKLTLIILTVDKCSIRFRSGLLRLWLAAIYLEIVRAPSFSVLPRHGHAGTTPGRVPQQPAHLDTVPPFHRERRQANRHPDLCAIRLVPNRISRTPAFHLDLRPPEND